MYSRISSEEHRLNIELGSLMDSITEIIVFPPCHLYLAVAGKSSKSVSVIKLLSVSNTPTRSEKSFLVEYLYNESRMYFEACTSACVVLRLLLDYLVSTFYFCHLSLKQCESIYLNLHNERHA